MRESHLNNVRTVSIVWKTESAYSLLFFKCSTETSSRRRASISLLLDSILTSSLHIQFQIKTRILFVLLSQRTICS